MSNKDNRQERGHDGKAAGGVQRGPHVIDTETEAKEALRVTAFDEPALRRQVLDAENQSRGQEAALLEGTHAAGTPKAAADIPKALHHLRKAANALDQKDPALNDLLRVWTILTSDTSHMHRLPLPMIANVLDLDHDERSKGAAASIRLAIEALG